MAELYRDHRPIEFAEVFGQRESVKILETMIAKRDVPHAMLFTGPSGCGKTTLARIVRRKVGCADLDFREINAAESRGIDTVREIEARLGASPMGGGRCRVYLIDECHMLTKEAQSAFLKILEDTPKHIYFLLATTDPAKLLPTIKTRCTEIPVKPLTDAAMGETLDFVASLADDVTLTNPVKQKITAAALGSARHALVMLNKLRGMTVEEDMLAAIATYDETAPAIELCRALMAGKQWSDIGAILRGLIDAGEDAEGLRRMVLSYFTKVLLGGGQKAGHAAHMIDCFGRNYFDTGNAGLVYSCYEATRAKPRL